MRAQFPSISVGGIEKKAFSMDLSGGGSSPSIFRVSFLTGSSKYKPNSNIEIDVEIGSFYNFAGYIVSVSERTSAAGNTTDLSIIDSSIKLDKLFVGLKGKHGPPIAPLIAGSTQKPINSEVDLLRLSPTNIRNNTTSSSLSNLSIFKSKVDPYEKDLILVGNAIDPCKNIGDGALDPCDPCSTVIADTQRQILDCEKNRSFQIMDVDYTFPDLISAASKYGIFFNNVFSTTTNYRAQYTGTLREVLNNWCRDFGYSFYWRNNQVNFFQLTNGIIINDSNVNSTCEVEEKTVTESIENSVKNINIAYFGKAGEIKQYDCSRNTGGQNTLTQAIFMTPVSLSTLMDGNKFLINSKVYKTAQKFREIIAAGNYSKDLRDIYCWNKIYGYNAPEDVKIGVHSLMGWNIKAVCHENTTDQQFEGGYSKGLVDQLYFNLIGTESERGTIFTKENVEALKKAGAYFIIAEEFGTKAYDFERSIAQSYCGKYWIHDTNHADADFIHPDGSSRTIRGLYGNVNYILPDLLLNHPYVKSSKSNLLGKFLSAGSTESGTNVVVLERPQYWEPDSNSSELDGFLRAVDLCKIQEVNFSSSYSGLKQNDKIFLVYKFGSTGTLPELVVDSEKNITHRLEADAAKDDRRLGLQSFKTRSVSFSLIPPDTKSRKSIILECIMPSESAYKIEIRPNKSSYSIGPIYSVIPKLEAIVIINENNINENYVAVNVNYQSITDNDLGKLKYSDGKCSIDGDEVITYAENILKDIKVGMTKIQKTISYTILGIPSVQFSPEDGLTNFSVKMDSSGTRTNLTFSNSFPVDRSESVKRNELTYLLKNQSVKTYINNLL